MRNIKLTAYFYIYNHDNKYDSDLIEKLNGAATASYGFSRELFDCSFDPTMIRFY